MATKITMQDLIRVLRRAAANPEGHSEAQSSYFSKIKENSVLVNGTTACCVAGYLLMQAHSDVSDEGVNEIVSYIDPDEWVARELGLSRVEQVLAFDACTHHEVHSLLADLLEAGLRLDHIEGVTIWGGSTYTDFTSACVGDSDYEEDDINLEQLKSWMREIAE